MKLHNLFLAIILAAIDFSFAFGVIIDTFESGTVELIDSIIGGPSVFDFTEGLPVEQVLEGKRGLSVYLTAGDSASIMLSSDKSAATDDYIELHVAPNSSANFGLFYANDLGDPALPTSFTENGQDRIRIRITEAPTSGGFTVAINQSNFQQSFSPSISFNGPGDYDLLYSDFTEEIGPAPADFNLASGVFSQIFFDGGISGATLKIADIRTVAVPEPSTFSIFLCVMLCGSVHSSVWRLLPPTATTPA